MAQLSKTKSMKGGSKKIMKGGRCCKCYGGRGSYGSSCYDNPDNCCKKTSKKNKKSKSKSKSKK